MITGDSQQADGRMPLNPKLFRGSMDLLVVILVSATLVLLAILGEGLVRIALGLVFVLFFPGYTLMAALFSKRGDLDGVERLALSFGLSIPVVILIVLILNYTPWGIRLYPILFSLLLFIVIMAGVAWYRRRRLPSEQRFELQLRPRLSLLSHSWSRLSGWDRVLSGLLVLAIIGAIGTLVYLVQIPQTGETFTEFYLLGPEGEAENYPSVLGLGEEATVILGIVNREHQATDYNIEVTINGERVEEVGPITLAHEEEWEQEVKFSPTKIGEDQEVKFLLYKVPGEEPYHELHLWIDVVQSP